MKNCIRFSSLLFLALLLTSIAYSQPPRSWSSAEMYQALRKLNVLGSVLYIAAHPDDENTRLITYFSKERLYRTGYLSLTRGDGGQNLIGNEQGVDLGLLRTQELLAARRVDGGEQFFSRAYDFGYSKNPEETFRKWNRERILSDVVRVIRQFQPDIIITRFPVTGEGGHGHHTASAILATEAFEAAADPNRFTDQLDKFAPWQVKRVMWNTFNFGNTNTITADQFKLEVGGYNSLLGKSYGEIAAESRSQHKSQGFGATSSRGEAQESFRLLKGTAPVDNIMDDVDLTWRRVAGGEAIGGMIEAIIATFDFLNPERSVKGLTKVYQSLNAMPPSHWRTQKLKELSELIVQCSGLFIDATSNSPLAVQTDSARITFTFNNRSGEHVILHNINVDDFDSTLSKPLEKNRNLVLVTNMYVPPSKKVTQPYWLERKMEEGFFVVDDESKIGQADVDPAYMVAIEIEIEGLPLTITRPVKYRFTDPVRGEIYQPLYVVPAYTVEIKPDVIVNSGNGTKPVYEWTVTSNKPANTIGFRTANGTKPLFSSTLGKGQSASFTMRYDSIHRSSSPAGQPSRMNTVIYDEQTGSAVKDIVTIEYDHIPTITYFNDAAISRAGINHKIAGKSVGYIPGAGDKVPEALEQMGYEVTILTDKELGRNDLGRFDAILTGVRAYNTNSWMNDHYDKLMKYVSNGGNLIVQYNTSTNLGPVRAKIFPYTFGIGRTRITDENSPVQFVNPGHRVLNYPNRITQQDFAGWIQERSIYHAAGWDTTRFTTILQMNDPGEQPDKGSLVIARHGKGTLVYTGLVFFRELPAGVAGAYRLMANIIALNQKLR